MELPAQTAGYILKKRALQKILFGLFGAAKETNN